MDKPTQPPPFVKQADQELVLTMASAEKSAELARLGFSRVTDNEFSIPAQSEQEKAQVFNELRQLGFCFARGREWSPAELFEYLRDRGLVTGPFTEIAWTRPGEWRTRVA